LRTLAREFDVLLTDIETDLATKVSLESSLDDAASFRIDNEASRLDFFTSGSTGEMKRVQKSLALFEREAGVLEQMWGAELGSCPVIGTVTHQHVFGMTFRILWPMLSGRPFHAEFHPMWEPLMAQLNGPAMLIASPAQLTRLGGFAPVAAANRPRLIITAGAALPSDAANETAEIFGCVPTEIFGSTEAGVIAWRRNAADPVLWQPLPTIEVAAREDGILMLRSPHASFQGLCEQADRISIDTDGRFRLDGRVDRISKIEGKRVSLQKLEREISALKWVDEAAVVVLGRKREFLGAVVKLSNSGLAELARMGKFRFERMLRRELSSTEDVAVLPRRWRFVDLMPMDGLGKRRVRDVAALLEQAE
jgi:acyl-coenzyme A synthetase/AMP-(fatty) acid ligase